MAKASERLDVPLELMTPEQPSGEKRRRRRVLVIADEADVTQLVRDNLFMEGWEIFTTGDGAHAPEHVRDVRPDVVLLDIRGPRLDGWDVYRRLKEDQDTRAIPVIMVAGPAEKGNNGLDFAAGADAIVILP